MKVKIKKVPYIEMIGDWMRVTYKEETVIEESKLNKIWGAIKNYKFIFCFCIFFLDIYWAVMSSHKLFTFIYGFSACYFLIGAICFFTKKYNKQL